SALQTEGVKSAGGKSTCNCWTDWEEQEITKNGIKQPRIPVERRVGNACEHWDRFEDDIQLAAKIGLKAHRFSIEWSKIEPEKGIFDDEAMNHYIEYVKALLNNNILPIPTLFHHTWPLWFEYREEQSSKEKDRRK